MNANELLAAMDGATVNILQSPEANALVLRALSLLAAAEANDGTTPETDNPSNIDTWRAVKDTSRRLERERAPSAISMKPSPAGRKAGADMAGAPWRDDDALGAARGLVVSLALSLLCWAAIAAVV